MKMLDLAAKVTQHPSLRVYDLNLCLKKMTNCNVMDPQATCIQLKLWMLSP